MDKEVLVGMDEANKVLLRLLQFTVPCIPTSAYLTICCFRCSKRITNRDLRLVP